MPTKQVGFFEYTPCHLSGRDGIDEIATLTCAIPLAATPVSRMLNLSEKGGI